MSGAEGLRAAKQTTLFHWRNDNSKGYDKRYRFTADAVLDYVVIKELVRTKPRDPTDP